MRLRLSFGITSWSSVRRCGQDCPRAGIGRNNGARVLTRSNARNQGAPKRQPPRSPALELLDSPLVVWFVAADKTVRAPGLAGITARGFQPAATPEKQRAPKRQLTRVRLRLSFGITSWSFGTLLRTRLSARRDWPRITARGFQPAATPENQRAPKRQPPRSPALEFRCHLWCLVRCCGQDCPRSGIGRNNGARVSTRSNARETNGRRNASHSRSPALELGCRLWCLVRCCGQDCPRSGIGRNNGARVSTRSNARKPTGAEQPHSRPRAPALELLVSPRCLVRCCGQDCPRAGIGRNNGARVSTRSNARKPTGSQTTPLTPACACA